MQRSDSLPIHCIRRRPIRSSHALVSEFRYTTRYTQDTLLDTYIRFSYDTLRYSHDTYLRYAVRIHTVCAARGRGGQGTQGHACAGTGAAQCPSHPRLYPSMYSYCIDAVSTSLRLAPLRLIHNDTLQDGRDTLIRHMPSDTIMIHTLFHSKKI